MSYRFYKLGALYPGSCIVCKKHTGSAPHQLAETLLYTWEAKSYHVAHARCVGAVLKSKISGDRAFSRAPKAIIEENGT